jgi:nucleoside-diphosphate-sugar epimerase
MNRIVVQKEVIEDVMRGTLNVLKSCAMTQSVRRVVYTSSTSVASFPEKLVEIIDESCWSSVDFIRQNKPQGWVSLLQEFMI